MSEFHRCCISALKKSELTYIYIYRTHTHVFLGSSCSCVLKPALNGKAFEFYCAMCRLYPRSLALSMVMYAGICSSFTPLLFKSARNGYIWDNMTMLNPRFSLYVLRAQPKMNQLNNTEIS